MDERVTGGDPTQARFERRATFVAIMAAPVIGYGTAQAFERWAVHQPFLAGAPLIHIPLGLASLALGGWLGFRVLDLIGRRIGRLLSAARRGT